LADPIEKIAQTQIAAKYEITADDIRNFKRRNRDRINTLRDKIMLGEWENIGDRFKRLAFLAIERAEEAMGKASAKDSAIIAGLAVDKAFLVENRGIHKTSIVHEHRHNIGGVLEMLQREMQSRGIKPEELPAQTPKALPPPAESAEGSPE